MHCLVEKMLLQLERLQFNDDGALFSTSSLSFQQKVEYLFLMILWLLALAFSKGTCVSPEPVTIFYSHYPLPPGKSLVLSNFHRHLALLTDKINLSLSVK